MKDLLGFTFGKLNKKNLRFHYLRIGNASPLLDELRQQTSELDIEWVQHEVESFRDYHFAPSYSDSYDGALINLDVNEENVAEIRKDFWENFIWRTEDRAQLLAIVHPDSSEYGSLTKAQLSEALSLIRLSDRPFELFELTQDQIPTIIEWLTSMASIVHRKPKEKDG